MDGTALSAWLHRAAVLGLLGGLLEVLGRHPGTDPTVLSLISVIPVPGANVTAAVVSSVVGQVPRRGRWRTPC